MAEKRKHKFLKAAAVKARAEPKAEETPRSGLAHVMSPKAERRYGTKMVRKGA